MLQKESYGVVVRDIAIGAVGLGFDSLSGEIEHSVANRLSSLRRFLAALLPKR